MSYQTIGGNFAHNYTNTSTWVIQSQNHHLCCTKYQPRAQSSRIWWYNASCFHCGHQQQQTVHMQWCSDTLFVHNFSARVHSIARRPDRYSSSSTLCRMLKIFWNFFLQLNSLVFISLLMFEDFLSMFMMMHTGLSKRKVAKLRESSAWLRLAGA